MNIFQKSLLAAGLLGLGSAVVTPAFAQNVQAYASGSTSIVLMNGASMSIGAELAAPTGAGFAGTGVGNTSVTVSPLADTGGGTTVPLLDSNSVGGGATLSQIIVNPGQANLAVNANASVEAAVATQITAGTLQEGVSYTRAWQSGLQ